MCLLSLLRIRFILHDGDVTLQTGLRADHVTRYAEFGSWLRQCYGDTGAGPVASLSEPVSIPTTGTAAILQLPATSEVDRIVLMVRGPVFLLQHFLCPN